MFRIAFVQKRSRSSMSPQESAGRKVAGISLMNRKNELLSPSEHRSRVIEHAGVHRQRNICERLIKRAALADGRQLSPKVPDFFALIDLRDRLFGNVAEVKVRSRP